MVTCKLNLECLFLKTSWHVEMHDGPDPIFTFTRAGWRPWRDFKEDELGTLLRDAKVGDGLVAAQSVDPWLMRERFFAVTTPLDCLSFLREFGLWRYRRDEHDEPSIRFPLDWVTDSEGEPLSVAFSELLYQREFFENALSPGPAEWERLTATTRKNKTFNENLEISKELVDFFGGTLAGAPIRLGVCPDTLNTTPIDGRITCHEIQDALRATILLDWIEGREWPKCAEPSCRKRFRRTSKHPMIYCSPKCSSRARQATYRKNKKQS